MTVPPDTIGCDRVELRRWRPGTARTLATVVERSRNHLAPWMPWAQTDPPDTEHRHRWLVDRARAFDQGDSYEYGIHVGDELVGGCGLHPMGPRMAAMGYWLAVDGTGRGLATDAARGLVRAAAGLGITCLVIRCDEANHSSAGVAARLGFACTGREHHAVDAPEQSGTTLVWTRDLRDRCRG